MLKFPVTRSQLCGCATRRPSLITRRFLQTRQYNDKTVDSLKTMKYLIYQHEYGLWFSLNHQVISINHLIWSSSCFFHTSLPFPWQCGDTGMPITSSNRSSIVYQRPLPPLAGMRVCHFLSECCRYLHVTYIYTNGEAAWHFECREKLSSRKKNERPSSVHRFEQHFLYGWLKTSSNLIHPVRPVSFASVYFIQSWRPRIIILWEINKIPGNLIFYTDLI